MREIKIRNQVIIHQIIDPDSKSTIQNDTPDQFCRTKNILFCEKNHENEERKEKEMQKLHYNFPGKFHKGSEDFTI